MGSDGGTATTGVVGAVVDTDVGAVLVSPVADCVADFVAGFLARDAGVFLTAFVDAEASSASSAATFLARLGLSTIGSRFKPFSSA